MLRIIGYKRLFLFFRKRSELARVSVQDERIIISAGSERLRDALLGDITRIVREGLVVVPEHRKELRGGKRVHYALSVPIGAPHPRFLTMLYDVLVARPESDLAGYEIIWRETRRS